MIPLTDGNNILKWDQSKAHAILNVIQSLTFLNFQISFGSPITTFKQVPVAATTVSTASGYVTASGYSEFFYMPITANSTQINTPSTILPGASTRYWIKNNNNNPAPHFAHLQTQEISIDLTGSIVSITTSDLSSYASKSVANPSMQVTSTVYGAQ